MYVYVDMYVSAQTGRQADRQADRQGCSLGPDWATHQGKGGGPAYCRRLCVCESGRVVGCVGWCGGGVGLSVTCCGVSDDEDEER